MNKGELIDKLASIVGTSAADAGRSLQAFIDTVTEVLADGDSVTIPGFGTFAPSHRAAREGRNPQTGESMQIPASTSAKFKPGKALKDALNGEKK
ncbi:MAG: HU family DNA-binding protein [Gammaproteobacteria bacterium]